MTNGLNIRWIVFVASIATKLRLQGVTEFELSPGPPPFTVAAYVPGAKVIIFLFLLIEHSEQFPLKCWK